MLLKGNGHENVCNHVIFFGKAAGDGRPVSCLTKQTMDNHNGTVISVFVAKGVMGKFHKDQLLRNWMGLVPLLEQFPCQASR